MSKLEELIQELCPNGVEYRKLEDIIIKAPKSEYGVGQISIMEKGEVICYTSGSKVFYINESLVNGEYIFINDGGQADTKYFNGKACYSDHVFAFTSRNINVRFLYHYLLELNDEINENYFRGGGIKNLVKKEFIKISVPIPPIEVQSEIVRILDNFTLLTAELTAELTVRKEQYNYYFKKILSLKDTDYETMPLKSIGKVCMCKRIMKHQTSDSGDVPFYKIGTFGKVPDSFISKSIFEEYKNNYSYPKKGDILISCSGTIGRTVIFDGRDAYFQDSNIVWIDNDESIALNKYLFYVYKINPFIISTGGTISRLYNSGIENAEIKVPSIEKQKEIISILDKFDTYCNDITQGLPAEIELRQKQYEYYREKLLTFKELE